MEKLINHYLKPAVLTTTYSKTNTKKHYLYIFFQRKILHLQYERECLHTKESGQVEKGE